MTRAVRADRTRLPAVGPPGLFRFAQISKDALSNGLGLWSAEHRSLPVVNFAVVLPAGSSADFEGFEGLAAITGDMLDEGTGHLSAIEVNAAFARIGTHLDTDVSADATMISVTTLKKFSGDALSLLASCVMRPTLAAVDFERVRQLRLTRLVQVRNLPSAIADRAFMQLVYGSHPYAHMALGTEESLKQLTIETVKRFHADQYAPSNATLIATGDIGADEFKDLAASNFSDWGARDRPFEDASLAEPPLAPAHRLVLVNKAGAPQTEVRIGAVGLARNTPDYHPLIVLNMILGGQFVSRINMKLRQEKGLTYGAGTAFDFRRGRGPFMLQTSVQSDSTAEAVRTSLEEIGAIRNERPPTPEEVGIAKAALTRGYVRNFETAEQLARALAQLVVYGLPDDYFDTFTTKVDEVSVERVCDVAVAHLDPDRLGIALVADAGAVTPQLVGSGLGEPVPLLPRL